MFKVGDEVFIKAEITDVHEGLEKPYFLYSYNLGWVSEEKIIPADKTYEQGLADAWELAKKLFAEYKDSELCEIFGKGWSYPKLMEFTCEEALAKIEAYEREKEIKVGDVVVIDDEKFLVTKVTKTTPTITIDGMRGDGDIICYSARQFEKTGKHIDIGSLLKQIGE